MKKTIAHSVEREDSSAIGFSKPELHTTKIIMFVHKIRIPGRILKVSVLFGVPLRGKLR